MKKCPPLRVNCWLCSFAGSCFHPNSVKLPRSNLYMVTNINSSSTSRRSCHQHKSFSPTHIFTDILHQHQNSRANNSQIRFVELFPGSEFQNKVQGLISIIWSYNINANKIRLMGQVFPGNKGVPNVITPVIFPFFIFDISQEDCSKLFKWKRNKKRKKINKSILLYFTDFFSDNFYCRSDFATKLNLIALQSLFVWKNDVTRLWNDNMRLTGFNPRLKVANIINGCSFSYSKGFSNYRILNMSFKLLISYISIFINVQIT